MKLVRKNTTFYLLPPENLKTASSPSRMDRKITQILHVPDQPTRFKSFITESKFEEENYHFYLSQKFRYPVSSRSSHCDTQNKEKLKSFLKGDLNTYSQSQIINFLGTPIIGLSTSSSTLRSPLRAKFSLFCGIFSCFLSFLTSVFQNTTSLMILKTSTKK